MRRKNKQVSKPNKKRHAQYLNNQARPKFVCKESNVLLRNQTCRIYIYTKIK